MSATAGKSETTATAMPLRDFESLRSAIIKRRGDLPKRLAQVAAFALKHPDDMAFGTAASIAEAAAVQPSTLVRFAHQLGYDGFSDLQTIFRERLRERSTSSYEERLALIEREAGAAQEEIAMLNGFLSAARQSVDTLAGSIDPQTFKRALTLLAEADTIFLVAKRRAYPLAAHMAYALGKLKIKSQIIGTPNGIDGEMTAMATPKDAAIAVSFSPYASESIAQAETMARNGVPIVAMTDSAFSPLAACATVWFEVSEADYAGFRSLAASMALAMALPVGIAETRRKKAGAT